MEGEFDTNSEQSKQEAIDAVRDGRALPTPEFALQEGGEMLTALHEEIEKLNPEELAQLLAAVEEAEKAATPDEFAEKLTKQVSLLDKTGHLVLVVPFFLGTLATRNPMVGVAAAYGIGLVMKQVPATIDVNEQQRAVVEKEAGLLKEAIERAKELHSVTL